MLRGRSNSCPICNSYSTVALEFNANGSMRSDGVVLDDPLTKFHCFNCGAVVGKSLTNKSPYHRSSGSSIFERQRHRNVAQGLINTLRDPPVSATPDADLLEIGAGGFQTASIIKNLVPGFSVSAIEECPESPVIPEEIQAVVADFFCWQTDRKFDVCYSNNVIEHISDPSMFLRKQRELIRESGFIVVCCPAHLPASNEILFADHLFTFSPKAMLLCGKKAGLRLIDNRIAPWDSLCQLFILVPTESAATRSSFEDLSSSEYLLALRQRFLDEWMLERARLGERLHGVNALWVYGAGEFAQLLRCYFPEIWGRVEGLVVDDLSGVRRFDRPICHIDDCNFEGKDVLIAVKKNSRLSVLRKLASHGVSPKNIICPEI